MSRELDVVVVGGGGLQAQAMLSAADRGRGIGRWLAVDLSWRDDRKALAESLGVETAELDVLADPDALRDLVSRARLVANFAGPYYRTGGAVLDACLDAATDYLDICDDADATVELLRRDGRAREADVRALIGMGSSPGVTNVLIRAAVDALGPVESVEISWVVDVADVGDAALEHLWHIFSLVDANGVRSPVPAWEDVVRRRVVFPAPLGELTVIELSHPEPLTVPKFLPVRSVTAFGGIAPDDALVVNWALARLGGGAADAIELDGRAVSVPQLASALYRRYRERRPPTPYVGSGLVVDVHTNGNGLRFASGDSNSMEESTGIPAAAGIQMMLADQLPSCGVLPPECLEPSCFFPALGAVSTGSGSLALHRLVEGEPAERIRIRDLLAQGQAAPTVRGRRA